MEIIKKQLRNGFCYAAVFSFKILANKILVKAKSETRPGILHLYIYTK